MRPHSRCRLAVHWITAIGVMVPVSVIALAAQAAQDPFGDKSPASPAGACAQLTGAFCKKQSTSLVLTSLGYVTVAVLVAALLRAWMNKGMRGTGASRMFGPMALAAGAAGALVGIDPARGPDLACCLASGVFRAEVLLADSGAGRVVLLGVLPAIALYTLVVLVIARVQR